MSSSSFLIKNEEKKESNDIDDDATNSSSSTFSSLKNYVHKDMISSLTMEAFCALFLLGGHSNAIGPSAKWAKEKKIFVLLDFESILIAMGLNEKKFSNNASKKRNQILASFDGYRSSLMLKYCSEFNISFPYEKQEDKQFWIPSILNKEIWEKATHYKNAIIFIDVRLKPKNQMILDVLLAKSNEQEKFHKVFFFEWVKYSYAPHKALLSKYSVQMFDKCQCVNYCLKIILLILIIIVTIIFILPTPSSPLVINKNH